MRNEKGFIEELVILVTLVLVALPFIALFVVRFQTSNGTVSGIVYNTTNDSFLAGNTNFSVRASEDTYVSEENRSSFCLPPNSPYIDLVNRAAEDKNIKVVVTTSKYFSIQAPWTCRDNVTVKVVGE